MPFKRYLNTCTVTTLTPQNKFLKFPHQVKGLFCETLTSVDETTTPSNKKCNTTHDDTEVQNYASLNMTDCGST